LAAYRGATANVVEFCVTELCGLVQPGSACIGMEWWLGRLNFGESLPFHTDRDRSLRKLTGEIVHPMWSSILYLNAFPASPTIVYDQILAPDGHSWIPPKPLAGKSLDAVPNHYVIFRGDLRHGVVADETAPKTKSRGLRLTLLVNYWDRRPIPPNCREYDGSIYPSIHNATLESGSTVRRSRLAA